MLRSVRLDVCSNVRRMIVLGRPFLHRSRSCWQCGSSLPSESSLFCPKKASTSVGGGCGAIQELDRQSTSYFDLFGVKKAFTMDQSLLEGSFKQLQKQLHPDKFANASIEEKRISAANSSFVNQAYQTLKQPMARVDYILTSVFGITVLGEGGMQYDDPALMMEMFELREQVEDMQVGSLACIASSKQLKQREQQVLLELQRQFEEATAAATAVPPSAASASAALAVAAEAPKVREVTRLAVHLKYLSKVVEELDKKVIPVQEEATGN